MSENKIWKVCQSGLNGTAIVLPELVDIIEKENSDGIVNTFHDNELDAYKKALEVQNNVVNDLTGTFESETELNKQATLLGTLLAVSLMNMAKTKGNHNLANMEIWMNFFNQVLGVALGNIETMSVEKFQEIVSPKDIKEYLVKWIIVYISGFCKHTPSNEVQKEVAESIVSVVDKCYELITKSNIEQELKNPELVK